MKGAIMAGGKGKRFGEKEKQLVEIGGKKLIERVIEAFRSSKIKNFYIIVSDNSPETKKYCERKRYKTIETSGENYHEDLKQVLTKLEKPLLTSSADIPFLKSRDINLLIEKYSGKSYSLVLPRNSSKKNTEPKDPKFIGLNIIGENEKNKLLRINEKRLKHNINTLSDLKSAKMFLKNNKLNSR